VIKRSPLGSFFNTSISFCSVSGSILGDERGGNTTQTISQRPNVTWVTGQFAKAG
jgi:hypothetical protein